MLLLSTKVTVFKVNYSVKLRRYEKIAAPMPKLPPIPRVVRKQNKKVRGQGRRRPKLLPKLKLLPKPKLSQKPQST